MLARWKSGPIRTRTGQDFVQLCAHRFGALGKSCVLAELARGAVELGQVLRNQLALGIVPGAPLQSGRARSRPAWCRSPPR